MSRRRGRSGVQRDAAAAAEARGGAGLLDRLARRFPDAAAELRSNGGAPFPLDGRLVAALVIASLLLTGYFYFGQRGTYLEHIAPLLHGAGGIPPSLEQLFAFWYRALSSAFWRIALPLLCIILLLRDSPREYGYRAPEPGHGRPYLLLYLLMLPVLAAASFLPGFQATYPLYARANEPLHFVLYQLPYALRFASVEAFFRGFLLFALYRRLGYYAVPLMTVPYCMIHFGKPLGETLGSIAAGLVLGFLALRSRSWVPGALLHWSIAVTMDVLSLAQRRF